MPLLTASQLKLSYGELEVFSDIFLEAASGRQDVAEIARLGQEYNQTQARLVPDQAP